MYGSAIAGAVLTTNHEVTMAKKKKTRGVMDRQAERFIRNVSGDNGPPESVRDWKADLWTAYTQGWMDSLTHAERQRATRRKRQH
jgi:hypothetical protein